MRYEVSGHSCVSAHAELGEVPTMSRLKMISPEAG